MKVFSTRNRPAHLGLFPDERLPRRNGPLSEQELLECPLTTQLEIPIDASRIHVDAAIGPVLSMLDLLRAGDEVPRLARIPEDLTERSRHLKGALFFLNASMVGICKIPNAARLEKGFVNPAILDTVKTLMEKEVKTFSTGIEGIMADLRDNAEKTLPSVDDHDHAIVILVENPRRARGDEPGGKYLSGAETARSALLASEAAVNMANYLRLLGYSARAHTATSSDLCLERLALAAGLTAIEDGVSSNPFVGRDYALAVISTNLAFEADLPLVDAKPLSDFKWRYGIGTERSEGKNRPFTNRDFADGPLPFENLNRVKDPTTFIDDQRVPRVPKRTDMFARARFGDFGKKVQDATIEGRFAAKSPLGTAWNSAGAAMILAQFGEPVATKAAPGSDADNAAMVKAALYFLGADAVGVGPCPDWAYYSHDTEGSRIEPRHSNAVVAIVDQGRDTMEGSSGDDWISYLQSMRSYLRGQIHCAVAADLIRRCGYEAEVHSAFQGNVLQPPLVLLAGLGEVSRIGEVILHPLLGPRLKTTVLTTDMPLTHDKPLDFGLQNFCNNCNKCARECPSGAITAGPKVMFNGYEIWKTDSQRCLTYRVTNQGGSMCGRCMKTCPWNLEGLFAEAPFRWAASHLPALARPLAKLDDMVGNGRINPIKKWWWDLEMDEEGDVGPADQVNERGIQPDLVVKREEQTLAVYPAPLTTHPYPAPHIANREAAIAAYDTLLTPDEYKERLNRGETEGLAPPAQDYETNPPVLKLTVNKVEALSPSISLFELRDPEGADLPAFTAGAHLEVVVAPEFLRQYSLCSDPADRTRYQIAVQREEDGRGGSRLMHRIFAEGRTVFVRPPENHFPLEDGGGKSLLMGGGIGVTPMVAMAHELHKTGRGFSLHYSVGTREDAAFMTAIEDEPWANQAHLHVSDEGSRADLEAVIGTYSKGDHLYTCGPDRYMNAVLEAASGNGWPEEALHKEFFAPPEVPEYENHPFTIVAAKSGKTITVNADESAADALIASGIHVDLKCSDGICGICKCGLVEGEVEHRDFVLSTTQREHEIVTCQSRAKDKGGTITLDI